MPTGRDILGALLSKTKAATPAYRNGWDEVFDGGRPGASRPEGKPCAWCDGHAPDEDGVCGDCDAALRADAVVDDG